MLFNWNVRLISRKDEIPFTVMCEGHSESDVREHIEMDYPNAVIESIVREGIDDLDINSLYENLKNVGLNTDDLKTCYLKERNLFVDELSSLLSESHFMDLNILVQKQDRLIDRLITSHSKVIEKWYDQGMRRYSSVNEFIRSEYALNKLLKESSCDIIERQLAIVVEDVCDILDSVDNINEILLTKIAKPFLRKAKRSIKRGIRKGNEKGIYGKSAQENVNRPVKEALFICEGCAKTFRAKDNKCPMCENKAELVVKGQEEVAPELDTDKGGPVKDTGEQQGKVPEHDLNKDVEESKTNESETTRKIVARGIVDKTEADRIATTQQGSVVSDEEDPEKYMVIVQEAKETDYKTPEDFTKQKRKLIEELADIQKKIKEIEKELRPLKRKKSELAPQVLEVLREAEAAGVRVGDVLEFIQEGYEKDPTYKKILAKAKEEKTKHFVKQLEELADGLKEWTDAVLKVKTESKADNGILSKAKALFKKIANAMDKIKKKAVKESKSVNESEEDFSHDVDLSLFAKGNVDVEYDKKVSISYKIETDYRSWGIKDVVVSVTKPITIPFTLVEWGDDEDTKTEKEITINPEDIKVYWSEGSGIAPQELTVRLNEKGEFIEAELEVTYWKP